MKCPFCNEPKTRVQETRSLANTVWRVRRCVSCDRTHPTQESRAARLPPAIHRLAYGQGTKEQSRVFKAAKFDPLNNAMKAITKGEPK